MTKLNTGLLATLGPLRSLTEGQIDELRPHLRDVNVGQGDNVFCEGEPGNALFIIVEGQAEVSKASNGGARVLATVHEGGVLGEISLIVDNRRSATATALTPMKLLKLPKPRYTKLMAEDSVPALKLTLALTQVLSKRLRNLDELLVQDDEPVESKLTEFEAFRLQILRGGTA